MYTTVNRGILIEREEALNIASGLPLVAMTQTRSIEYELGHSALGQTGHSHPRYQLNAMLKLSVKYGSIDCFVRHCN